MNATAEKINSVPPYAVHRETFSDAMPEVFPLFREHAREIELSGQLPPLRPALNRYAEIERDGDLLWLAVREPTGNLVGYAMYITAPCLLWSGEMTAILELVYVRPEHRGTALLRLLISNGERILKEHRVKTLSWSIWKGRNRQETRHKFLLEV